MPMRIAATPKYNIGGTVQVRGTSTRLLITSILLDTSTLGTRIAYRGLVIIPTGPGRAALVEKETILEEAVLEDIVPEGSVCPTPRSPTYATEAPLFAEFNDRRPGSSGIMGMEPETRDNRGRRIRTPRRPEQAVPLRPGETLYAVPEQSNTGEQPGGTNA